MELLALLVVLVAGYAAAGLVYRRYLSRRLPEHPSPPEEEPMVDQDRTQPVDEDGVLCPACGAANDPGFERCYNCANPLPAG